MKQTTETSAATTAKRQYGSTAVGFPSRNDLSTNLTAVYSSSSSQAHAHAPVPAHANVCSGAAQLYVLIACEESQAECEAFRKLGHIAFSCDVQPCRKGGHPEWHIHADVRPLLHGQRTFRVQSGEEITVPGWHLIIAHPPCTYLCKVGSQWMHHDENSIVYFREKTVQVNKDRYEKMLQAREFFFECLQTQAAHYVAVENPLPMALAELPQPSCYASPHWYGVKYTKKTLYWLRNLPPLFSTVQHPFPRCFVSSSRGKYRSRTFPQLADAIAAQWSSYILDELGR